MHVFLSKHTADVLCGRCNISQQGHVIHTTQPPLKITFDPSTTIAGSFPICKMVWDFGDGSLPVTVQFPDNPNISHIYLFNPAKILFLKGIYKILFS